MKTYKATTNKRAKSATIRVYESGRLIAKYRANNLSKDELTEFEYMTSEDIANFVKMNDCEVLR